MATERICHIDAYLHDHPRQVGCIRIAPEERSLAPSPLFTFGAMPDHLTYSLFGSVRSEALGCYVIKDGRVGYDAIPNHEGTALWTLAFNLGDDYVSRTMTHPRSKTTSLRHIVGAAACIHGPGYNIYGHWLVDFLPRLYVLELAGYDIAQLKYLLPHDCSRVGLDFLGLLGISRDQFIFYDPEVEAVQIDELILPTNLRTGGRLHTMFQKATQGWVNRVLPQDPRGKGNAARRMFVSRANLQSGRNLRNRDLIESLSASAGFEIVHPEMLSLRDQIALFREARHVVGEYGSGLHSAIYGHPALHCCALRGTCHWLGFIQSSLAHACGQTVSYVFGHAEAHAVEYDFEIEPENFRRALQSLKLEYVRAENRR